MLTYNNGIIFTPAQVKEEEEEEQASSSLPAKKDFTDTEQAGCLSVVTNDLWQELGALKEGWKYAFHSENR